MTRTPFPSSVTVRITDRQSMDIELERAELAVRENATSEIPWGVLITRVSPNTFVVAANADVPYGETHSREAEGL